MLQKDQGDFEPAALSLPKLNRKREAGLLRSLGDIRRKTKRQVLHCVRC